MRIQLGPGKAGAGRLSPLTRVVNVCKSLFNKENLLLPRLQMPMASG